jgi:hypothetical protein
MLYVNVGAMTNEGTRLLTKAALKAAVREKGNVVFDQTAMVHADFLPGFIELDDLLSLAEHSTDWELSVVGPDPYQNRRWYANVKVKNGEVKVS